MGGGACGQRGGRGEGSVVIGGGAGGVRRVFQAGCGCSFRESCL